MCESFGDIFWWDFVYLKLRSKDNEYKKQACYSDEPERPDNFLNPVLNISLEEIKHLLEVAVPKNQQRFTYKNALTR